jgi:hypothetical protein
MLANHSRTTAAASSPKLSNSRIAALSIGASCGVLIVSLVVQWVVYDDWLHQTGPLHLIGTSIAAGLTFIYVFAVAAGLSSEAT